MKQLKIKQDGYFQDLPQDVQDLVRELMSETIEQVEGWKSTEETFEDLECRRRDGFIPSRGNRGGLVSNQFTDLSNLWGSGDRVAHVKAQAEIERQIEYGLECARKSYFENNKAELIKVGVLNAESVSYHDLCDKGHSALAEDFSDCEYENLSDESSSIMFQVRFLYHGINEDGKHEASVSCAVNTEGPYHRSSIPWTSNVFCEGASEVEIEWTAKRELKAKLAKALNETSSKIF